MIRIATESDIPAILPLLSSFHKKSGYDFVPIDGPSITETLKKIMGSSTGAVFVAESDGVVGVIAGIVYPMYFNANHLTGQEMFWWVDENHRESGFGLGLLAALKSWAESVGAHSFSMMSLESIEPDKIARIYTRMGFKPSEHTFIKRLTWQ